MSDRYSDSRTSPIPQHLLDQVSDEISRQLDILGWSVKRLARESGVSPRTVYRARAGETMPSYGTLHALAQALGCELRLEIRRRDLQVEVRMLRDEIRTLKIAALSRGTWSSEEDEDLCRRWAAGEKIHEIAHALHRSTSAVSGHITSHRKRLKLKRRNQENLG